MNISKKQDGKEWWSVEEDKQLGYFISLLKMVSNESLLRSMNKLAEMEDYEIAMLYRDELISRGKLRSESGAIPGHR